MGIVLHPVENTLPPERRPGSRLIPKEQEFSRALAEALKEAEKSGKGMEKVNPQSLKELEQAFGQAEKAYEGFQTARQRMLEAYQIVMRDAKKRQ